MDQTIHQLVTLLITAIPTFLLIIFLTYYLKVVFFQPLEKVLKERYDATEGARKAAEESLKRATEKTAEYEAALRAARGEIYSAQEKLFKEMQAHAASEIAEARQRAEGVIAKAKADISAEVEAAKASLAKDSEALANQIADSVLRRRAA